MDDGYASMAGATVAGPACVFARAGPAAGAGRPAGRDGNATLTLARSQWEREGSATKPEREGRVTRTAGEADGFELFRRAVCERHHAAWEALIRRYRGMVLAWVRQHPSAAAAEDDDYWVTRVFERFWSAIGPERFGQFASLPALLQYLKLCAQSALLDDVRARHATRLEPLDLQGLERGPAAEDTESVALGRLNGREVWSAIVQALPDEGERLVIYLSFALDLKPRQIHERYPQRYGSVSDVYRVKRNVLERLRRCPRLQRLSRA